MQVVYFLSDWQIPVIVYISKNQLAPLLYLLDHLIFRQNIGKKAVNLRFKNRGVYLVTLLLLQGKYQD